MGGSTLHHAQKARAVTPIAPGWSGLSRRLEEAGHVGPGQLQQPAVVHLPHQPVLDSDIPAVLDRDLLVVVVRLTGRGGLLEPPGRRAPLGDTTLTGRLGRIQDDLELLLLAFGHGAAYPRVERAERG